MYGYVITQNSIMSGSILNHSTEVVFFLNVALYCYILLSHQHYNFKDFSGVVCAFRIFSALCLINVSIVLMAWPRNHFPDIGQVAAAHCQFQFI